MEYNDEGAMKLGFEYDVFFCFFYGNTFFRFYGNCGGSRDAEGGV